jgi:hypothetical protein
MEAGQASTSVEEDKAKQNQNSLIAESCSRIIEMTPSVPMESFEDAAAKLGAYHVRLQKPRMIRHSFVACQVCSAEVNNSIIWLQLQELLQRSLHFCSREASWLFM